MTDSRRVGSDRDDPHPQTAPSPPPPLNDPSAGLDLPPSPAAVAFLAEVQRLADELLVLDLDGTVPGGGFDPRWPEGER